MMFKKIHLYLTFFRRLRHIYLSERTCDLAAEKGLGYVQPKPSLWMIVISVLYTSLNRNHIGIWSSKKEHLYTTKAIEFEAIRSLCNLYKGTLIDGYFSSGVTEGNILACFIGKKYLHNKTKKKIIMIRTPLTHASIAKAGCIADVNQYTISTIDPNWALTGEQLTQTVKLLYTKGYRGFLIPITSGYNIGSSDHYGNLVKKIRELKIHHKNIHFFLWVDAAWNGLIEPFINNDFTPFKEPEIQMVLCDFSKFLSAPYPAGCVLYRQALKQFMSVNQTTENSSVYTMIGSRPGTPAVLAWTMLHEINRISIPQRVTTYMGYKNHFIQSIRQISKKIEIITYPHGLSVGLIFWGLLNNKLPVRIERKYNLLKTIQIKGSLEKKREACVIYKFHFIRTFNKHIIEQFINEITSLYKT